MADNAKKKGPDGCSEGYSPVFIWCFKKTIIEKIAEPLKVVEVPQFTDLGCEAALAALEAAIHTLENILAIPKKYAAMMLALLNYPFNVAQQMINNALSAIDKINKAINDLLAGSGLNDLIAALQSALQCSYLAESEIGKLMKEMLDALQKGNDITKMLSALKNMLATAAKKALDNLKKTPTEAINKMRKALENMMKQLGINDLVKTLKKLEKCVSSLCKAYQHLKDFQKRLPSSVDELLESAKMKFNSGTSMVESIVFKTADATLEPAIKAANDAYELAEMRY